MKLRQIWRSIALPSLLRRLVMAQMSLLVILWLGLIAYFIYDIAFINQWYEPKQMEERSEMILAVMEGLADRPEKLNEALRKIDEFQRDENRERDDPGVRVTMNAWLGDELVYVSPGEPGDMEITEFNVVETSVQYDRRVRTYARQSERTPARVVLVLPGDAVSVFITFWSSGIVLLPLLVSIPLLVVPAGLSVWIALRPFRELAVEVAGKGPWDLQPLRFRARHYELRPVVRSINELLRRLRAGITRERRFIADASHELRTPLAAMRINVEALRERSDNPEDLPLLESLVRSGDRATRLASQLLSLMRSDPVGPPSNVPLRLDELVQDRLAELAAIARQRNVELEFASPADPVWVRGEREGLQSLVVNLVENAIKYSPRDGTVSVRLSSPEEGVELSVSDAGPGIPAELRESVFDPFYRIADQTQEGNGLGLAIVKAVCDWQGAVVSLDDAESGGLRVTVRFPAADKDPSD
jgi:two-component system sensor histidine kinase QseC